MGTDASETPRARAHHVIDPLLEVDLAIELVAVRASDSYRAGDHAAKTIATQPGVSVVLVAVKPGGQMHEHHADGAITLQGIGGHVEFTVRGETGYVDTCALADRSPRGGAARQGRERERVSLDDL